MKVIIPIFCFILLFSCNDESPVLTEDSVSNAEGIFYTEDDSNTQTIVVSIEGTYDSQNIYFLSTKYKEFNDGDRVLFSGSPSIIGDGPFPGQKLYNISLSHIEKIN